MVVVTRPLGSRTPIWKSSPLPLLFHGLELPVASQIGGGHFDDSEELDGMEDLARDIVVRLERTERGLMFVQSVEQHTKSK